MEHGFAGSEAEWLGSLKADIDLSLYATNERLNEQILLLREAMQPLENLAHSHQNKDVLDALTASLLADLRGLQQFEEGTQYDIRSLRELLNNYSNTAHTHENIDVLDNISAELDALRAEINALKTGNYTTIFKYGTESISKYGTDLGVVMDGGCSADQSIAGRVGSVPRRAGTGLQRNSVHCSLLLWLSASTF